MKKYAWEEFCLDSLGTESNAVLIMCCQGEYNIVPFNSGLMHVGASREVNGIIELHFVIPHYNPQKVKKGEKCQ